METINDKAMRGISTYLTRRGFDIIEEGWAHGKDSIDLIARDGEDLVFVTTRIAEGGSDAQSIAIYAGDAQRLTDQGRFLRSKFVRSELDL